MNRSHLWIVGVIGILVVAVAVFAMQKPGVSLPFVGASAPPIAVPAGTQLSLRLETSLSTKTSRAGDRFQATVTRDVAVDGITAIPAGATVAGRVVVAEQPGKASGRGRLQLHYDELEVRGQSYELATVSRIYESESGTKKDVALIGGGAVGGAIVGGILGDGAGDAAKGAAVGGAAGTGASLMTRGPQLEFPRGTVLTVRLDQAVEVARPRDEAKASQG